jgi:hypothetical protein
MLDGKVGYDRAFGSEIQKNRDLDLATPVFVDWHRRVRVVLAQPTRTCERIDGTQHRLLAAGAGLRHKTRIFDTCMPLSASGQSADDRSGRSVPDRPHSESNAI